MTFVVLATILETAASSKLAAQSQPSPACALLTIDEIRQATGPAGTYVGCKRETVPRVGDDAFSELCPKSRGPAVFVKAAVNDVVVQMDAVPPATAASVTPAVLAVARAAVEKLSGGRRLGGSSPESGIFIG